MGEAQKGCFGTMERLAHLAWAEVETDGEAKANHASIAWDAASSNRPRSSSLGVTPRQGGLVAVKSHRRDLAVRPWRACDSPRTPTGLALCLGHDDFIRPRRSVTASLNTPAISPGLYGKSSEWHGRVTPQSSLASQQPACVPVWKFCSQSKFSALLILHCRLVVSEDSYTSANWI